MKQSKNIFSGSGSFELRKAWQWLLYLYVALPVLLFILAYLTRELNMGITFARLYHSYCMYIVNPVPDMPSLTGVFGAALALAAAFWPLYRRDFRDFGISMVLIAANAVYYYYAVNYLTIRYLTFG